MTTRIHRHLVSVWNPSYAVDAMDAHVQVLLDRARKSRAGELDEDDVYVWWGRVRSANREGGLDHLGQVLALDDQAQEDRPVHLYLTDYRSLYVADVGEVTVDDVRVRDGELAAMPEYYRELAFDCFFRVWDFRRLVADDTEAVIDQLRHLKNVNYHHRPVSLYGGMVDLPLVVEREVEVDWFGDRAALTDGLLWAETDAELRGESARISSDLRDNLFGRKLWFALETATRSFISSAESVLRARREDPVFDFSGPAVQLAKAVETEVNAIVFGATRRFLGDRNYDARVSPVEGRDVDLGRPVPHQSLGAVRRLLLEDARVRQAIEAELPRSKTYLLDSYKLPRELEELRHLRNPAAHSDEITAEEVYEWRALLLGIGCHGLLPRLAEVKVMAD